MHENTEENVYVSGMIITDFKRNVVHLNGKAKKKHESLTENTSDVVISDVLRT